MSILQVAIPLATPLACILGFGIYARNIAAGRKDLEAVHGVLIWGGAFLFSAALEYLMLPAGWA